MKTRRTSSRAVGGQGKEAVLYRQGSTCSRHGQASAQDAGAAQRLHLGSAGW